MDDLDRTEEMPRSADDLSPLSVGRARGRRPRGASLPPPIPARAKRWTPSPTIDGIAATPPVRQTRELVVPDVASIGGVTAPAPAPIAAAAPIAPLAIRPRRSAPIAVPPRVAAEPTASPELEPAAEPRPAGAPALDAWQPAPASDPAIAPAAASASRPRTAPVAVPPPSLTEELQMLSAGELDVDPTEYFDRHPEPPRRRHGLVIGAAAAAAVLVAIVVVGVLAGITSGAAPAEPPAAPAVARAPAATSPTPSSPPPRPTSSTPTPTPAPRSTPTPPRSTPTAAPARDGFEVTTIPAGASVTVIDGGVATVIGTTPVIAALDRSRGYDLVFALPGHQTSIFHLAARETSPLTVDLRSVAIAPAPARPVAKPRRRGR